ncbi:MAG: hypothetical protein QXG63_05050 [Nitrososphaerales archaeon]
MTKKDLLLLTLKQLKESFDLAPECLALEGIDDKNGKLFSPTIVWRRLVELEDNKLIQDPNNAARTVIVTYNKITQQMTANIYFRDVVSLSTNIVPDATVSVVYKYWPYLYKSFRIFMGLTTKLQQRRQNKQHIDYMRKLASIFPTAGDNDLMG